MTWKVLGYEDGHLLVEYAGGTRLNVRVDHAIDAADPDRVPTAPAAGIPTTEGRPKIVGLLYRFDEGDVLAEHSHGEADLHRICVAKGRVLVRKESGDVEAKENDVVTIALGEKHSVEPVETPSFTFHPLVGVMEMLDA